MLIELECSYCPAILTLKDKSPTIICHRCGQTNNVPAGASAQVNEAEVAAYFAAAAKNKPKPTPPPLPPRKLFGLSFSDGLTSDTGIKGLGHGVKSGPGKEGKAILITNNAVLYYPSANHIDAQSGCIDFWVRTGWPGNDERDYVFFEIGTTFYNRMSIYKDAANNLRFVVWGPKSERGASQNIANWQAGDWHHIRATWHINKIQLYVDGFLDAWGSMPKVTMPDMLAPHFYIGSNSKGEQQANAVIDEFAIYSSPLT